ncbi:interferon alpha-inducible protein 27-like protein 1 isoform X3 [Gopherus evgoodei]|uniref:interferon alpha-inducible protein 27-like protein 1 isoform X3 n=1 Tax=Gopherus evgoodei TaxID=1825980 RepID=UPI0011D02E18|nr:interferon alpha-inducible protein 27-like protein 1 isoform X3 [Gopherus evgoodei]
MSFQATQALGQVWDRDPECHSYRQGLTKRSRYPSDQGVWVRVSVMVGVVTVAVPAALGAAGFTGAGIAAGTLASKMMSAAAVASGGGVAAGSTVAVLQSVEDWLSTVLANELCSSWQVWSPILYCYLWSH